MTVKNTKGNTSGAAPLQNMEMLDALVAKAIDRDEHLPGIVGFSGPSGFGKSTAAAFVSARRMAAYIEVRSVWTKKAFLENLVRLLGMAPRKTINELLEQATEELAMTQRPLMIDEFDHAIEQNLIELVRDIYEQAKSPIVIIGEERLQMKLKKWERFDGRVFTWAQAMPADLADARSLNQHYKPGIYVEDDLLQQVPCYEHLSPVRQRAILNMAFQLGVDGVLKFRRMIAALDRGDYARAAIEALDSKWAKEDTPQRAARVAKSLYEDIPLQTLIQRGI